MNKRDWLRSQGFQVGERGRLSPAMLTALEDYPGEESSGAIYDDVEVIVHDPQYFTDTREKIREPKTMYGLTREGKKVPFVLCFSCNEHMMFCECEGGIKPPPNVLKIVEVK